MCHFNLVRAEVVYSTASETVQKAGERRKRRKENSDTNVRKSNVIKPPTKSPRTWGVKVAAPSSGGHRIARIQSKRLLKKQMVSGTEYCMYGSL